MNEIIFNFLYYVGSIFSELKDRNVQVDDFSHVNGANMAIEGGWQWEWLTPSLFSFSLKCVLLSTFQKKNKNNTTH